MNDILLSSKTLQHLNEPGSVPLHVSPKPRTTHLPQGLETENTTVKWSLQLFLNKDVRWIESVPYKTQPKDPDVCKYRKKHTHKTLNLCCNWHSQHLLSLSVKVCCFASVLLPANCPELHEFLTKVVYVFESLLWQKKRGYTSVDTLIVKMVDDRVLKPHIYCVKFLCFSKK